jgi:hypothetical protein
MRFRDDIGTGGNSDLYLKIKDKEKVKVIFRGDPFEYDIHWFAKKSSLCEGVGCRYCAENNKAKFRFKINAVVRGEDGKFVAKIFEQGPLFYADLREIGKAGYEIEKTVLIISRDGTGLDTTYSVLPAKDALTPLLENELEKVQLHNLADPGTGTTNSTDDDVPF